MQLCGTFFGIAFLWDWNENWPFPVLWPLLSFPNFLAYWVQHFNIIMLRNLLVIINSYSWSDKEGGNLTSPPKTTKISCQILRLSHSFFWFRTLQCWKQVFQPSLNTGRTIYWNILGSQINTCISMGVIFFNCLKIMNNLYRTSSGNLNLGVLVNKSFSWISCCVVCICLCTF